MTVQYLHEISRGFEGGELEGGPEQLGPSRLRWARSVFVIVNPAAAGGEVGDTWGEISLLLNGVVGPYAWSMTQGPGDATELTRQALRAGFEVIASLGGDGTHNEVINGFFERGRPVREGAALALLPYGTGGDLRKTLNLSGDLREASERLTEGRVGPCDVGHLEFIDDDGLVQARHFINIASFGLGGLVDRKVNASSKALGGRLSFMLGTLRAFAEYVPPRVRLVIDDGRVDVDVQINSVAVANGRYFGGGMKIAPNARIDDGLFDVIIPRHGGLPKLVESAIKVYDGRHFESGAVSHLQARRVYAEPVVPGTEVLLDVDGEAPGRLPASFEVMPGAVQIVR